LVSTFLANSVTKSQEPDPRNANEAETAPQDITLTTRDGVDLRATYFKPIHQSEASPQTAAPEPATPTAGTTPAAPAKAADDRGATEQGKTTLPFILLHDWEGSRNDLFLFAEQLQKAGCAVLVPDLRGHGESTTMAQGMQKLDLAKFKKQDLANMVLDIEACKKFLVQKNNEGELNVDLLNVLAIGKSSALAIKWIISDWYEFPPFKGGVKQGQDVKSLILISPVKKLEQVNLNADLKHPMFAGRNPQIPNLPTLIVWSDDGSDSSDIKESRSIYETMRKGRPDLSKIKDDNERADRETVFDVVIPRSRLLGGDLLNQNQALRSTIMEFVAIKVGAVREKHVWQDRNKKKQGP
jgi:hypothetical protein